MSVKTHAIKLGMHDAMQQKEESRRRHPIVWISPHCMSVIGAKSALTTDCDLVRPVCPGPYSVRYFRRDPLPGVAGKRQRGGGGKMHVPYTSGTPHVRRHHMYIR